MFQQQFQKDPTAGIWGWEEEVVSVASDPWRPTETEGWDSHSYRWFFQNAEEKHELPRWDLEYTLFCLIYIYVKSFYFHVLFYRYDQSVIRAVIQSITWNLFRLEKTFIKCKITFFSWWCNFLVFVLFFNKNVNKSIQELLFLLFIPTTRGQSSIFIQSLMFRKWQRGHRAVGSPPFGQQYFKKIYIYTQGILGLGMTRKVCYKNNHKLRNLDFCKKLCCNT